MPPQYYGGIAYYAAMAAHGHAIITTNATYDKRQKSVHRCNIADTHGPVQLTVPIAKPHGIARARRCDVALSDHGAWWHVHRVTLESAYGRAPFFEFYIDRFLPFLTREVMDRYPTVTALDTALDATIRSILLIETAVESEEGRGKREEVRELRQETRGKRQEARENEQAAESSETTEPSETSNNHGRGSQCSQNSQGSQPPRLQGTVVDWREVVGQIEGAPLPYWQVRGAVQGFTPNLSVLDLIFNLGPEAPLYLQRLIAHTLGVSASAQQ